jgi:hypothetical protein
MCPRGRLLRQLLWVGPNAKTGGQATAKSPFRRVFIGGVIVAVAALVAAGLVLLVSNVSNAISTGTGTATITWTPVSGTAPTIGNLPSHLATPSRASECRVSTEPPCPPTTFDRW